MLNAEAGHWRGGRDSEMPVRFLHVSSHAATWVVRSSVRVLREVLSPREDQLVSQAGDGYPFRQAYQPPQLLPDGQTLVRVGIGRAQAILLESRPYVHSVSAQAAGKRCAHRVLVDVGLDLRAIRIVIRQRRADSSGIHVRKLLADLLRVHALCVSHSYGVDGHPSPSQANTPTMQIRPVMQQTAQCYGGGHYQPPSLW